MPDATVAGERLLSAPPQRQRSAHVRQLRAENSVLQQLGELCLVLPEAGDGKQLSLLAPKLTHRCVYRYTLNPVHCFHTIPPEVSGNESALFNAGTLCVT